MHESFDIFSIAGICLIPRVAPFQSPQKVLRPHLICQRLLTHPSNSRPTAVLRHPISSSYRQVADTFVLLRKQSHSF